MDLVLHLAEIYGHEVCIGCYWIDFHIGVAMKITAAVHSNLRLNLAYIMAFKAIPFKWI